MQLAIVVLVVAGSALYAAARLLPAALVERALRSLDGAPSGLARALRRFAGRPRDGAGAGTAGACSSCSAAATHAPKRSGAPRSQRAAPRS